MLGAEFNDMKSLVLGRAPAPEAGSTAGSVWFNGLSVWLRCALLPNPSLERRPREAGHPWPAAGSQAHFRLPAKGVLPHGSAQLER